MGTLGVLLGKSHVCTPQEAQGTGKREEKRGNVSSIHIKTANEEKKGRYESSGILGGESERLQRTHTPASSEKGTFRVEEGGNPTEQQYQKETLLGNDSLLMGASKSPPLACPELSKSFLPVVQGTLRFPKGEGRKLEIHKVICEDRARV